MAESRRRRRIAGKCKRHRNGRRLRQLPWRAVENPHEALSILNDDQVEAIHLTSLRILEELGVEVMSETARDHFRKAGAVVDEGTGVVRLGREIVDAALETAPSTVALRPRNPAHAIQLGGRSINFGLVAGPPNVHDRIRGRRPGNFEDYCNLVRLAQYFNIVHLLGNQVVAPMEMAANTRHLETYRANLELTDKVFHCSAIGRGRVLDAVKMLAIARETSVEALADEPGLLTIISVNSPRRYDMAMAEGLMAMSELGQMPVITPFTLMGAMAPITLAGALAQQNAEALIGVVLTQLVRPGSPVAYGAFTSNVDMRSGAPVFGSPENAKANIASGQLARRYGLPYRSSNVNASNAADAQSVYETAMALWGAVLGHAHLVYHAAGWLEGGLTASFEKVIIDIEMLQSMAEFLRPISVSDADLGFDAVAQVATGGHFFGAAHTMERYESAFYEPLLSDWQNYERWSDAGAEEATERATGIWQAALADYEAPEMPESVKEALDAYIARRYEEIGSDEP